MEKEASPVRSIVIERLLRIVVMYPAHVWDTACMPSVAQSKNLLHSATKKSKSTLRSAFCSSCLGKHGKIAAGTFSSAASAMKLAHKTFVGVALGDLLRDCKRHIATTCSGSMRFARKPLARRIKACEELKPTRSQCNLLRVMYEPTRELTLKVSWLQVKSDM